MDINKTLLNRIIENALNEDIGDGDITTDLLISKDVNAKAFLKVKTDGVIAGLKLAEMVFRKLDANISWNQNFNDGDRVKAGDILAVFEGSYRAILTGERTALNFLQRMSGIATRTSEFVEAVKGTKAKILDTRKTVPGLRMLDKYAVKTGGGTNHRIGLYDLVLIKDNHIKIAGGITNAVAQIKSRLVKKIKIEVEAANLDEVTEALNAGVDIIMLDNMDNLMMSEAVKLINGRVKTEASGNMSLERIKEVAATGVDFISVGALTHSVTALDIAQYIR